MIVGVYRKLASAYKDSWGYRLYVTDADGRILYDAPEKTDCECGNLSDARRLSAAQQTLAFGDPVIGLCCDGGFATWSVPVMENARITGSLVVQGVDLDAHDAGLLERIRKAAQGLMELAVKENLVNAAAMQLSRSHALQERDRFLAIEAAKEGWSRDDLRTIYLREEPGLLTAIKESKIAEARSILNRILTSIYSAAEHDLELLKSCILELVVMMSRAAVEVGADPALLFGNNYRFLADLSKIGDEEELSVWIRNMLESLIESIRKSEAYPQFLLLNKAMAYMQEHLHEPLRRDEVARIAGISPSHFSKIITERMGQTFTGLLNRMRIGRARHLILNSEYNLTAIAMECGFFDQSHLNKSFRKATGQSPGEFRKTAVKGEVQEDS